MKSTHTANWMRGGLVAIHLALLGGVLGCSVGSALKGQSETIQEITDRIHPRAYLCAPYDLAVAQSQVTFARDELDKGNFMRARDHLRLADKHATLANERSKSDACIPPTYGDVEVEVAKPVEVKKLEPKPTDRDGDGILDKDDQCPDEPEDFDGFQDEDGCPDLDNDGDGIPDQQDACPNVPEDPDGYLDEDGCPDLDNDGDGILDTVDKCPNSPEDYDGFQDDDGCPDEDNDGDGILDVNDLCPLEKETYNGYKDEDGCPDKPPLAQIEGDQIRLNQKVFFKTAKSTILDQSLPLLNDVAAILNENQSINIRIEGHTDSRGSARSNQKLSDARAASVRRYLMGQGIDGSRMESVGFGEERPIETNKTKEGRATNRRVEIHITKR